MRIRNAVLTGLLAAAGVAVFADDAQALGRRRNRGAGNCCGGGPAMAAPATASPCCGAVAGGPAYIGAAGMPGNVIVSGQAVPNPMPGVITTTGTTATTIPATNLPTGTVTTSGAVIPTTYYYNGTPGGVVPVGGISPYYTPYTPGAPIMNAEAATVNTVRRGLFFRRY